MDDVRNELGTSSPLSVNVAKLKVRIFRSTIDTFLALCVKILGGYDGIIYLHLSLVCGSLV